MLKPGEFDRSVDESGVEVWITQMGGYMNMNTAFIDRENEIVAIVDPFDSSRWVEALEEEDLRPTHLLYTHTHRDHAAGFPQMKRLIPDLEVWGHAECNHPGLLSHVVFRKVEFTNLWTHAPQTEVVWNQGNISLTVTHSPGHAPGHVTLHGHGVYHAGDLLFTYACGRDDLPGSDPLALLHSLAYAKGQLKKLPLDWRLIPGHRYDWIDGTTPDWVSISSCLEYNYALNSPNLIQFE